MNIINTVYAGVISSAPPLSSIFEKIVNTVITLIGSIAILAIIVAGIMYMTSGGDTTGVAVAKKGLIYAIIGLVVSILSYVIVKVISGLV